MERPIKVIVISSVRPEATSAGQLPLHRHLCGQPEITTDIYGAEPERLTCSSIIRRLFGRLNRTRFHQVAEDFWVLWQGRWLDWDLPRSLNEDKSIIVLTVAHGDACMAAWRFARKHRLPLVTFFHDWWPDIPNVHSLFRRRLEEDFRDLYKHSTTALCVSEGMKAALGSHPRAYVLNSIPKKPTPDVTITSVGTNAARSFKVLYFGNLIEYGPMLADALKLLAEDESVRFEVRGADPKWPVDFRESMRGRGLFKDFAPEEELGAWLSGADAFLIAMAFEPHLRRRMETSFPSKLIECSQLRKPLVIWGPEYCSAVRWARQGTRAACVTDREPVVLRQALKDLVSSPDEQQRLAAAAQQAAEGDFNPGRIQAQFIEVLREAIAIHNSDKP
jgi:glycosyltransferase involved in cell wall biosynthesis